MARVLVLYYSAYGHIETMAHVSCQRVRTWECSRGPRMVVRRPRGSRVYLGVHWLSDIAAGVSAGLPWLATTTIGVEPFRKLRLIRKLRTLRSRAVPPPGKGEA